MMSVPSTFAAIAYFGFTYFPFPHMIMYPLIFLLFPPEFPHIHIQVKYLPICVQQFVSSSHPYLNLLTFHNAPIFSEVLKISPDLLLPIVSLTACPELVPFHAIHFSYLKEYFDGFKLMTCQWLLLLTE